MEILKEQKKMPWQVTELITDSQMVLIQIKKFYKNPHGGFTFKKYDIIKCSKEEWKIFKNWLKGT